MSDIVRFVSTSLKFCQRDFCGSVVPEFTKLRSFLTCYYALMISRQRNTTFFVRSLVRARPPLTCILGIRVCGQSFRVVWQRLRRMIVVRPASVYVHVHAITHTGGTFMRTDDEHSVSCRTNFLFIPLEINLSSYQYQTTQSRKISKLVQSISSTRQFKDFLANVDQSTFDDCSFEQLW